MTFSQTDSNKRKCAITDQFTQNPLFPSYFSWSRVLHYILEISEPMSTQRTLNPDAKVCTRFIWILP